MSEKLYLDTLKKYQKWAKEKYESINKLHLVPEGYNIL